MFLVEIMEWILLTVFDKLLRFIDEDNFDLTL